MTTHPNADEYSTRLGTHTTNSPKKDPGEHALGEMSENLAEYTDSEIRRLGTGYEDQIDPAFSSHGFKGGEDSIDIDVDATYVDMSRLTEVASEFTTELMDQARTGSIKPLQEDAARFLNSIVAKLDEYTAKEDDIVVGYGNHLNHGTEKFSQESEAYDSIVQRLTVPGEEAVGNAQYNLGDELEPDRKNDGVDVIG